MRRTSGRAPSRSSPEQASEARLHSLARALRVLGRVEQSRVDLECDARVGVAEHPRHVGLAWRLGRAEPWSN